MKINCGLRWYERQAIADNKRKQWHRWFAWRPVRMTNRSSDCRWWERVERRGIRVRGIEYWRWAWEYRAEGEE